MKDKSMKIAGKEPKKVYNDTIVLVSSMCNIFSREKSTKTRFLEDIYLTVNLYSNKLTI